MVAMTTNPIMSQIMGAAGDLGLSSAAQGEAADMAKKLKKLQQDPKMAKYNLPGSGFLNAMTSSLGASSSLFPNGGS